MNQAEQEGAGGADVRARHPGRVNRGPAAHRSHYVANALIERGHAPSYVDLYTSTGPQNRYAAMLAGVLRFKDLAAARASAERLTDRYDQFDAAHDRRGMHQCQVLALIGKNRAEGIGKWAEARYLRRLAGRAPGRAPARAGGRRPVSPCRNRRKKSENCRWRRDRTASAVGRLSSLPSGGQRPEGTRKPAPLKRAGRARRRVFRGSSIQRSATWTGSCSGDGASAR